MTEPITPEELAEWRAVVEKTTPGPWKHRCRGTDTNPQHIIDYDFLVLARIALPRLVDEVEAGRREISSLRTYLDRATEARRDHQRIIRGWQQHAERNAKMLGCIAIDSTIEAVLIERLTEIEFLRSQLREAQGEVKRLKGNTLKNEQRRTR